MRILYFSIIIIILNESHCQSGINNGVVLDRNKKTISNAQLKLIIDSKYNSPISTSFSKSNGDYQFRRLPSDTYAIFVTAKGYKMLYFSGIIVKSDSVTKWNLTMSKDSSVKNIESPVPKLNSK